MLCSFSMVSTDRDRADIIRASGIIDESLVTCTCFESGSAKSLDVFCSTQCAD